MRAISISASVGCGIFLLACSGGPGESTSNTGDEDALSDVTYSLSTRILPLHANVSIDQAASSVGPASEEATAPIAAAATSGPHLKYFGGPVMPKVNVIAVYWGKGVKEQSTIEAFFPAITNSRYFDWLKEYDTKTESIGRGTFGGFHTIKPTITTKALTDHQIEGQLAIAFKNKELPAPTNENLYMVYFPPGFSINSGGTQSCVDFCAYHSTFKKGSQNVMYGVMPDLGSGGCELGCGNSSLQSHNTTEVSSHEMIEAVTDPAVGLAQSIAAPLGWYDPTNGEIGDICVGIAATEAGFTVQKEWSNKRNACVSH